MALQARAEATRRKIVESAVDLFGDMGYGETGLADVLQRAGVSKGAFYYHFDSKEAVAVAIIEEFRAKVMSAVNARIESSAIDESAPQLNVMIVATFATAEILRSNKTARIGNQLLQALTQISSVGSQIYSDWTAEFTAALTAALKPWELREGHAAEVAEAMWAGVLGSYLLSEALGDDPYPRLASSWRTTVHAIAPESAIVHYNVLLDHTIHNFQAV